MYIVQRLGRDGDWHDMPDEVYGVARVCRFRAYELSFESPDRSYRCKDMNTGSIQITFGPEGTERVSEQE